MPVRVLYIVALIEWFSTLAVQIIAMRLAIPVVGSSIVLTSVFLGIILLALSAGYWSGGIVADRYSKSSIIKVLWWALLFAGIWYVMIAFSFEVQLLEMLLESTQKYILTLFLTSILLFFVPIFIASHSIPLLTELLPDLSKGKSAGKMLFASTIGSFLWSVLTSIFFFQTIGVYNTAVMVGCSLCFLAAVVYMYAQRQMAIWAVVIWLLQLFVFGIVLAPEVDGYYHDSAYQQIHIYDRLYEDRPIRVFSLNDAYSSAIYTDDVWGTPFQYINETISLTRELQPKNILVIWSAGFVYPQLIAEYPYISEIDTIDIDPEVLDVTQNHFLQTDLHPKISFFPYSGRYAVTSFLNQQKSYDLIFLDAYNGKSIPDELVTKEFFIWIQDLLSDEWVLIANLIMDSELRSDFSQKVFATLSSVRDNIYQKNITQNTNTTDNFLITTQKFDGYITVVSTSNELYTDNLSTAEVDVVEMLYMR